MQVAQVIPDGYAAVAHKMSLVGGGRTALVTDAFKLTASTFPGIVSADAITDAFINAYKPVVTNSWRFLGAIVRFGPSPTGPTFETGRSVVGTEPNSSVTANTAVLVQKRTALGGRSNRGRFFVPGPPETLIGVDGVLAATVATAWQNAANNYKSAAEVAPEIDFLVILHDATVVGVPTPVTALTSQSLVGTQRRRLR
jgi:hypothetical protein